MKFSKTSILQILVLLLVGSNLLLIFQNLHMRGLLENVRPAVPRADEVVTPFLATDAAGDSRSITFLPNGPRRFLLFFSPTCPYSAEQLPIWRETLHPSVQQSYQVLGVVRDTEDLRHVSSYLEEHDAGWLPFVAVSPTTARSLKLSMTPLSIAVAPDGRIEGVWPGVWNAEATQRVGKLCREASS